MSGYKENMRDNLTAGYGFVICGILVIIWLILETFRIIGNFKLRV